MNRIRVLIADDHVLLAEGIAAILRPGFDVIGTVTNGRSLVGDAGRLQPDLITLDIGMPGLNGLEAARQIRKLFPRIKLVFITQQVDLQHLKAALSVGGDAFVGKQSASSEVLEALECVLKGGRYITPVLRELFWASNTRSIDSAAFAPAAPLTPRQRQVLQLIAEGHSNKAVADALGISPKTVEFHKDALMRALGLHTTAELTRYALSQGIVNN